MSTFVKELESEEIKQDSRKLMTYQRDIKESTIKMYNELHCEFVCENEDLSHEEILLVKRVFDFLKSKA